MSEDEDRAAMQRWEKLAQGANEVFSGQPMEDVGGALALLTAMLIAGLMQDEGLEERDLRAKAVSLTAHHGIMVVNLIPTFLEVVEESGGWEQFTKKGKH
jgi:hypothetical protein